MTPIPSHLVFPLTVEQLRQGGDDTYLGKLNRHFDPVPIDEIDQTAVDAAAHELCPGLLRYQHVVSGEAARGADKLPVVGRAALVPSKKESA